MTRNPIQFYRRYSNDGSCKVICMNCYATVGTGLDRPAVDRMEAEHRCGEWLLEDSQTERIDRQPGQHASGWRSLAGLRSLEYALMKVHPGVVLVSILILLYAIPTGLEIFARSQVNTWVAVILPGNLLGCAVLIILLRRPKMGLLLYAGLAVCESCWHIVHVMRGVTMAWIADLVPTLVVMALLLMRRQRARGMHQTAFS